MLKIIITVDATASEAQGIKEDLAMHVEKYGDTRVVSIEEIVPQQTKLYEVFK